MSVPHRTQRATVLPAAGNELLDSLPAAGRVCVLQEARFFYASRGTQLFAPGEPLRELWFPTTAICSVLVGLKSGQRAEAGTVGSEGVVGIPAILGAAPTEFAVVQGEGAIYALRVARFRQLMDTHSPLRDAVRRYIAYAYHVAKQTTACNAYHGIERRIARWLLTMQDRAGGNEFILTQELLSHMVAATRPRVAEAAARLRSAGVIDYERGRIRIRDRGRLETASCECYAATSRPGAAALQP